jgi:hypothetical protein
VVGADHPPGLAVDHQLLEAAELRLGEGVQHGALGARQRQVFGVEALDVRRHLDDGDVGEPPPGLLFGQAHPGDLVGGVQEVGILAEVELGGLTHDVLGGRDAALAGLEHLHRGANQVADGVDVGHAGPHRLVDQHLPMRADGHAQHVPRHRRVGRLSRAHEHEVGLQLDRLAAGQAHEQPLDLPGALDRDRLGALQDLDAPLAHAVDHVPPQVLVDVVQARGPHQR